MSRADPAFIDYVPSMFDELRSIPPKFAVSEIIGFLKGKCAIKIFDRHLELKKRYWGRHFWAKGYCVSTVGLAEGLELVE